jgi:hypothetical protein
MMPNTLIFFGIPKGGLYGYTHGMINKDAIKLRWELVGSGLNERDKRLFAAAEVRAAGWGGLTAVSAVTGLAPSTIGRGLQDLEPDSDLPSDRIRRIGGGPDCLTQKDGSLLTDLKRLVEPATLGDPVRPLLWVSKSYEKLAASLQEMGHDISPNTVRKLLSELGFSRQSNRKTDEGTDNPDRDAQFEHINEQVISAQDARQPVISVDTKKRN